MILSSTVPDDRLLAQQDDGQTLTYGQVRSFASQLKALDDVTRHLAFILSRNSLGSLASYLGCLESEAIVPLMLDASLDETLLEGLFDQYQPRFVFMPQADASVHQGWQVVAHIADYGVYDTGAAPCVVHDDLALLLTTSGSTGTSKLVRLSADNIVSNAESIATYLEIDETERPITSLPMSYTYGLSIINSHVLRGACLVVTNESLLQKHFWDAFEALQATSLAGVPYTYQMLHRLRFTQRALPTLRTLTQAGGKLSSELHRYFAQYAHDTGRRFFVMYGQTEATARMSYLPADMTLDKIGSIGIAIPGGTFTLVDEEGNTIDAADTEGELVYQGPNVSLGYATSRDDLARGDERNGVLVTGDMARRDSDGFYYITGRKKRFLKLFGKRVSLDECEQRIAAKWGIECACAGHDDALCIYLVNDDMHDTLRTEVAQLLGVHPSGLSVRVIDQIPRNDAGKIQYKDLPQ